MGTYLAVGLFVAAASVWSACGPAQNRSQQSKAESARLALFHPDPNHISNRLYRRLHIRVSKDGTEYGFDDLDPLLWMETRYLLTEPSHGEALRLLDEFLSKRAEQQISETTTARETEKVIAWKKIQDHWKLLIQLWGDRVATK